MRETAEAADVGVGTLLPCTTHKRGLLVLVYKGALAEVSDKALDFLAGHGPLVEELL